MIPEKHAARLRILTRKLMALTDFPEDRCKLILWIEYQAGGLDAANEYVDMAASNRTLNEWGMRLLEKGLEMDDILEALHSARTNGGDAAMVKVAKKMMKEKHGKQVG